MVAHPATALVQSLPRFVDSVELLATTTARQW